MSVLPSAPVVTVPKVASALVLQADARTLPLPDASVDLIITSPPYFALRSYRDGEEPVEGQLGSERTPEEYLENLWAATAEMVRVLRETGSLWVNLGDKYAGSGGFSPDSPSNVARQTETSYWDGNFTVTPKLADRVHVGRRLDKREQRYTRGDVPKKSLMMLPQRYAWGCIERLGLILRRDLIWDKPSGLPESVTDRCRTTHEYWFHFVKSGRYYAAIDEIREPLESTPQRRLSTRIQDHRDDGRPIAPWESTWEEPGVGGTGLGKLPGSVWTVAAEPLKIPEEVGVEHFAAFPAEFPRRIIAGWAPTGTCVACGEGRRPVIDKAYILNHVQNATRGRMDGDEPDGNARGTNARDGRVVASTSATIVGYACACTPAVDHPERRLPTATPMVPGEEGMRHTMPTTGAMHSFPERQPTREYDLASWAPPPTRPAVVLDPFGGTGTVAMMARAMGRVGISVDLSSDYCRLAEWRIFRSNHAEKALKKAAEGPRRAYGRDVDRVRADLDATLTALDLETEARRLMAREVALLRRSGSTFGVTLEAKGIVSSVVPTKTNGLLIAQAVQLYLAPTDTVMDVTFGRGLWWTDYHHPGPFITHDLKLDGVDFRNLPESDGSVDAIFMDPPYTAMGGRATSTVTDFADRYGLIDAPRTPADVQAMIDEGITECTRVLKPGGRLFVKVGDYISSGRYVPGRQHTVTHALSIGLEQTDEFVHASGTGPQPSVNLDGTPRRQVHSRRAHSFLVVFLKPGRPR